MTYISIYIIIILHIMYKLNKHYLTTTENILLKDCAVSIFGKSSVDNNKIAAMQLSTILTSISIAETYASDDKTYKDIDNKFYQLYKGIDPKCFNHFIIEAMKRRDKKDELLLKLFYIVYELIYRASSQVYTTKMLPSTIGDALAKSELDRSLIYIE